MATPILPITPISGPPRPDPLPDLKPNPEVEAAYGSALDLQEALKELEAARKRAAHDDYEPGTYTMQDFEKAAKHVASLISKVEGELSKPPLNSEENLPQKYRSWWEDASKVFKSFDFGNDFGPHLFLNIPTKEEIGSYQHQTEEYLADLSKAIYAPPSK